MTRLRAGEGEAVALGGSSGAPPATGVLCGREAQDMCQAFESLNAGSFGATDAEGRLTYISAGGQDLLAGGDDLQGQPFCDPFLPSQAGADSRGALRSLSPSAGGSSG